MGQALNFEDDGPSVTVSADTPADELTVDETDLTADDSANYADNFSNTPDYGADDAGTLDTDYALSVKSAGVDSGLVDVATGEKVLLTVNGSGVVEGRTESTNHLVFTVSVSAAGVVSLDQLRALEHPDATDPDDSLTLSAADLIRLTRTDTITDKDGDQDTGSAYLDIGQALNFEDDGPDLAFGNLIGTGTINPQYGYWSDAVGADQPGDLDISLDQFQLVRPNGTTVAGSSYTFDELGGSPDGSGAFLFAGSLTADFDNNAGTADTTVDFTLTAYADGTYALDLVQGFGSSVEFSSDDGSLESGGPDPVQTLGIGDRNVVFFAVNPTASAAGIKSAIQLGAADYNEAYLQENSSMADWDEISANGDQPGNGTYPFINDDYEMNVSESGIGVNNNVLEGDNNIAASADDESFVVNPDTLLTKMKVFIDNSVGGYDPASESLYYTIYYADGTAGPTTKVLAGDLADEADNEVSFELNSGAGADKLIDAVQLTMTQGSIKIPTIEFTSAVENLGSDILLDFTATLTDADGDSVTSEFSTDLYANELEGLFDFNLIGSLGATEAFNVDLPAEENTYRVEGFDLATDTLVLLGDAGATLDFDYSSNDSVVTVTESGGQETVITVVGVDVDASHIAYQA
ncbi:hypothetical protein ISX93_16505 [Pseudomonas sp. N040]|nr:hypothetical protein [Pseudomonas sp. N040]MBW7015309.1 hypothetical protein [Pseudomonas sp. N040]